MQRCVLYTQVIHDYITSVHCLPESVNEGYIDDVIYICLHLCLCLCTHTQCYITGTFETVQLYGIGV